MRRAPSRNSARAFAELFCVVLCLLPGARAGGLPIEVVYGDGPGEGFHDPELGEARRTAFEYAADVWARTLAGDAPVVIAATMPALGGSGRDALLAQARAATLHRRFSGSRPDVWYGAALASALAGRDANGPELPEIEVRFNADVDGAVVLGSAGWYYGTDAQPGFDVDFVTVALHELGHGLNFFDTIDPDGGRFQFDTPGIFDLQLLRPGVGPLADIQRTERRAAIVSGSLVWAGGKVVTAFGGQPRLYTPNPYRAGASISHWDTMLVPDELMEPFYTGANHDPGLLLPALEDMGWQLLVPTPTPRAALPSAPPSPTPTPRVPPSPARFVRPLAYVTNFDSASVSVIDTASHRVVDTIAVDDGPLGVASAPNGEMIYVAGFASGMISGIDTRTSELAYTLWTGGAPHSVAVTPDGARVLVTNTALDSVAVIETGTGSLLVDVPAGRQPAGIALSPDGSRAYVASFGDDGVAVIDLEQLLLRAISSSSPFSFDGHSRIAVAPGGEIIYVNALYTGILYVLSPSDFGLGRRTLPVRLIIDDIVIAPSAAIAYLAATIPATGTGHVYVVETTGPTIRSAVRVGGEPTALALAPGGAHLYVVAAASDSVSVIRTADERVVATIPVGSRPMGIAMALAPEQVCAGDCNRDGAVIIDELVAGVRIALGEQVASTCPFLDADGDDSATVEELVDAVASALHGCGR